MEGQAREGQEGDTKHGVHLLNDKTGIHLKVPWMPTEDKDQHMRQKVCDGKSETGRSHGITRGRTKQV